MDEVGKKKYFLKWQKNHYHENEKKPFEHYFPGCDFNEFLSGKTVLDLGCSCGGKAFSYAEKWNMKIIFD